MSTIGPTGSIPIHIARAYGVTPNNRPINATPTPGPQSAIGSINPPLHPEGTPNPTSRIVAARVSGGIDFLEGDSHSSRPAAVLQMYTHPADRNAAATAVNAGRLIDITA